MKFLSTHRWFLIMLFSLLLVMGGAVIAIVVDGLRLKDEKKRVELLESELKSLFTSETMISEEYIEISNENLRRVHELKDKWMNVFELVVSSPTPIECYFNLGKEVESIRNEALLANIAINAKCYFGFTKYLGTEKLPAQETLIDLDRQAGIIRLIASLLIEAAPKEILFIKREAIKGEAVTDDDVFVFPLHQRLSLHEVFYSDAFKVSFIGKTQTLRLFLNGIEAMRNPVFIRDVEINRSSNEKVELFPDEDYAVFSVVLELFNLKEPEA